MSEYNLPSREYSTGAAGASKEAASDQAQVQSALRAFLASYDELFVLTGPAGVGKTATVAAILSELGDDVPLVLLDASGPDDQGVMASTCSQLGVETSSLDWELTLDALATRLKSHVHAFLVIDNAHDLDDSSFEELRLLSYLRCGRGPQLQVILLGHQQLLTKVQASDMAQLGLWHVHAAALDTRRASEAVKQHFRPVEDEAANVQPLVQPTPLRPRAAPSSESEPRGELARLIPMASRGELMRREEGDLVNIDRLPVPSAVYEGELTVVRRPLLSRLSLLVLSPLLLGAVYWLGYSQARESGPDTALAEAQVVSSPPSALTDEPVAFAAPLLLSSQFAVAMPQAPQVSTLPVPPLRVAGSGAQDQIDSAPVGNQAETEPASVDLALATPGQAETATTATTLSGEIQGLLDAAGAAMERDHLRTPADASAWGYYDLVLALQPDNPSAQLGMRRIADRYETLTKLAISRDRFRSAQTYINRGLSVRPEHSGLTAQQGELNSALAAAREAELLAEQERLAAAPDSENESRQDGTEQEPGGLMGLLKNIFTPENENP